MGHALSVMIVRRCADDAPGAWWISPELARSALPAAAELEDQGQSHREIFAWPWNVGHRLPAHAAPVVADELLAHTAD